MSSCLSRAFRHRSFVVGAALTGFVLGMALLSLVWTPYSPTAINIRRRMAMPSADFWLGTDPFGRDVLSLILAGAQNSLTVGLLAVGGGLVLGSALGLLAAARRGWIEELVMRFADFTFAF
ncbi:MAG: ABC transporter permease, partial [Ferrovibrio sp.]